MPSASKGLSLHFFEKGQTEGVVLFPAKGCIPIETSGCVLQLRSEKNTPYGRGHTAELLLALPCLG